MQTRFSVVTCIELRKLTRTKEIFDFYAQLQGIIIVDFIEERKGRERERDLFKAIMYLVVSPMWFLIFNYDFQETKGERQGSRTTSTNNASSATAKSRTWQPSLQSISEAASWSVFSIFPTCDVRDRGALSDTQTTTNKLINPSSWLLRSVEIKSN